MEYAFSASNTEFTLPHFRISQKLVFESFSCPTPKISTWIPYAERGTYNVILAVGI